MTDANHIIEQYGAALSRVAASYEADPQWREDLLQEILFAIHRALPSLNEPERLRAFIFRIAHNRGVSHVVRQARLNERETEFDDSAEVAASKLGTPGPEQAASAQDRSTQLMMAIRRLKLPYRQVITLVLEDLSYEEIADALGISVSNVGVRINRARNQLKESLSDD